MQSSRLPLPYPIRKPHRIEQLEMRIAPAAVATIDLADIDGVNGFRLDGSQDEGLAGFGVSEAGDVNGDGFDDVIIGAVLEDPNGLVNAGSSYVVFGKADGFDAVINLSALDGTDGFRIDGVDEHDIAGRHVASAGDMNGDGFGDLIIGAPRAEPGGIPIAGSGFVVFGKASFDAVLPLSSLNGTNGFRMNGSSIYGFACYGVRSAGDINGDGFDDVLVSSGDSPNGVPYAGSCYVVFGKAGSFAADIELSELESPDGFRLDGVEPVDVIGFSTTSRGDVNGDGFDDLFIGSPLVDPNDVAEAGAGYVVFGTAAGFDSPFALSSLDGTNGFRLDGTSEYDYTGWSVSVAGDVNGDGFDDMIIGGPFATRDGFVQAGVSYLVFGGTDWDPTVPLSALDGSNGFRLDGLAALDHSGFGVGNAGDFNGDGFDDLMVGAYDADPDGRDGAGETYLIFGKPSGWEPTFVLSDLNGTNGILIKGAVAGDESGGTVDTAGDVNGDGFDDIIIRAERADPNGVDQAGSTYVIFGFDTGAVTHAGGVNAETLTGDANPNVIIGGLAGDTLLGHGGADVLRGGEGADMLAISDLSFKRIVGGTGFDTVRLDGEGLTLDLTTLPDKKLTGIEQIDVTGSGNNALTLNVLEVLNLSDNSNTLAVKRNAGDAVNIGAGWTFAGQETIGGKSYDVLTQGAATLKIESVGPLIELLNAKTARFIDVDGDRVTVTVNKGTLGLGDFTLVPSGVGAQLQKINFSDDGSEFQGANLTIDARPQPAGDGRVNVGYVNATGIDLGNVKVYGDLGQIDGGDTNASSPGLANLSVYSLGALGTDTQAAGGSLQSDIAGRLSKLSVATDVTGTTFRVAGRLESIRINGSLTDTQIASDERIVMAEIGSIVRSTISALGVMAPKNNPDVLAIGRLSVDGSVEYSRILAGYDAGGIALNPDVQIGAVVVGGDWIASDLVAGVRAGADGFFGTADDSRIPGGNSAIVSRLAGIIIQGQASGTAGGADHFGFTAEEIGSLKVDSTVFPLTNGRDEFNVGTTNDLRLREVA